jgi:hypothetical protein
MLSTNIPFYVGCTFWQLVGDMFAVWKKYVCTTYPVLSDFVVLPHTYFVLTHMLCYHICFVTTYVVLPQMLCYHICCVTIFVVLANMLCYQIHCVTKYVVLPHTCVVLPHTYVVLPHMLVHTYLGTSAAFPTVVAVLKNRPMKHALKYFWIVSLHMYNYIK